MVAAQSSGPTYNYVRSSDEESPSISSNILSAGFGIGGQYPYMGTTSEETPNLSLLYQNTIVKHVFLGNISLGGLFSYKSIYSDYQDNSATYTYKQRWDYFIIGSRISYHIAPFPANKNIEFYGGAMAAYYITTFKFITNDPNYSEPGDPGYSLTINSSPNFFSLSIYTGIRSWVTSHSSIWIEVGYGYTSMAFGVSYKV